MDLDAASLLTGVVSFCFLVLGAWCVGEGGEILGDHYDASIIGGLIIAWLNTAPEAIFFITALSSGNTRFAVGAVTGSSIVVCTVALGTCLYIGAHARRSGTISLQPAVKKQCFILLVSCSVPALIAAFGFQALLGGIGVAAYAAFLITSLVAKVPENVSAGESKRDDEEGNTDQKDSASIHDVELGREEEEEHEAPAPVWKGVCYLLAGGVLILTFSSPFINTVVAAAEALKVNPILLAFFLAPVASEMPEILESVSLARKGSAQNINIAFSNLVGGTITKTTLLCGVFCFFGVSYEMEWESPSFTVSLLLLTASAAAASAIGFYVRKLTSQHGLILFALFGASGLIQFIVNREQEVIVLAT